MEILLLIAIIVSASAGLYVAVKFNTRTTQIVTPLINDKTENAVKRIEAASGALQGHIQAITGDLQGDRQLTARLEKNSRQIQQQVQEITNELQRNRELVKQLNMASGELQRQVAAIVHELREDRELAARLEAANGELRQQVQAIADELPRNRDQAKHLDERIDARLAQFGRGLEQLDHQVAEAGESLTQQSARIAEIYRYVIRRETQAGGSSQSDLLLLAMLEAESYVDGKGWGERPRLYALTAPTSAVAAHHELADGLSGTRPEALVPVEQAQLPDGDMTEVLTGMRWPADVVGCVLVTELAALPPRNEEDGPVDALAAGQWASTCPDGRPARLIIGVRRDGEHLCGLRIKGEDEMQVRAELAGDLVSALLGTF